MEDEVADMHEYSLTQQIIQTIESHIGNSGVTRVTDINLVIGDNSGCAADSIALYFSIIAKNSLCAGARLNIERIIPKLQCKVCGKLFERRPFEFKCPEKNCPGEGKPTDIGREFYIKSIEIEDINGT